MASRKLATITLVASAAAFTFPALLNTNGNSSVCDNGSASESSKNIAFWSKRWSDNLTGWHQQKPHASLINHGDAAFPPGTTVLVPLCGKTVDLTSLAERGRSVIGVEGAHKAIVEYGEESPAVAFDSSRDTGAVPNFETYTGAHIESGFSVSILRGDFFDLNLPTPVDGVWDRAAFVAIQPAMRKAYADTLGRNLAPGGTILMSTFYRAEGTEEAKKGGPPFSVSSVDIWDTFGELDWVDSIALAESVDIFTNERYAKDVEKWKKAGLTDFRELVFVIKSKETWASQASKIVKGITG